MKYFYDPATQEYYGFEEDGSQDHLIKDTYVTSSLEEIAPKNIESDIRSIRNMKLLLEVDPIAGNALRWAALTADQQAAWAAYRQALLDVTAQAGFPDAVVWPTKPTA